MTEVKRFRRLLVCIILLTGISACTDSTPLTLLDGSPQRLSDWNLFTLDDNSLTPSDSTLVFRPANTLFTDYAHKMRTLWIPNGSQAKLLDGEIDYPLGTILSKTFYYPVDSQKQPQKLVDNHANSINLSNHQIIETRLLVRRASDWAAFPYVWNEEQSEAFLRVAGTSLPISLKTEVENLDFVYFIPNENQCAGCHVTDHPDGDMQPLGAIAKQLNSHFDAADTDSIVQIDALVARGWLDQSSEELPTESWLDESLSIQQRGTAYLNMQCGHCHNPQGAADTSALLLDGSENFPHEMGVCKPPVAAGGGAGDLQYAIVPGEPDQSILIYRMLSSAPDEMMPELGRSLPHTEGVALIRDWISQLPGNC